MVPLSDRSDGTKNKWRTSGCIIFHLAETQSKTAWNTPSDTFAFRIRPFLLWRNQIKASILVESVRSTGGGTRASRPPLSLIEPTPQWAWEQQREPRSIRGEPRWTETHTCKHTLTQWLTCHMLSHLHRHQAACNPRALCVCVGGDALDMHAVWTTHEQTHKGWKMHLHRQQRCSGGDNRGCNLHVSCKTHTCSDFAKYGTYRAENAANLQEEQQTHFWLANKDAESRVNTEDITLSKW